MPSKPPSPWAVTSGTVNKGVTAPVVGLTRLILPLRSVIQIKLSGPHKISHGRDNLLVSIVSLSTATVVLSSLSSFLSQHITRTAIHKQLYTINCFINKILQLRCNENHAATTK